MVDDDTELTAEELRSTHLDRERDGYDVAIVDDLLTSIADLLDEGASIIDIVPENPREQLPTRRVGYRRAAVEELFDRLLRRGSNDAVAPTHETLLNAATLVLRRPSILGAGKATLGRVEYAGDGVQTIFDAATHDAIAVRKTRLLFGSWVVTDAPGREIGRIRARSALTSSELRRARLRLHDELVARCSIQWPSLGVRLRHWARPVVRHYQVTDPAGVRLATLETTEKTVEGGGRVTLQVEPHATRPLRHLLIALAVGAATPLDTTQRTTSFSP